MVKNVTDITLAFYCTRAQLRTHAHTDTYTPYDLPYITFRSASFYRRNQSRYGGGVSN